MNILEIQTSIGFGGSERHTLQFCKGAKERGHKVALVTKIQNSQILKELDNLDIKIYDRYLSCKNPIRFLFTIYKAMTIIKKEEIDIIHTHLRPADIAGIVAGYFTRTPAVPNLHGGTSSCDLNNEFSLLDKTMKFIHGFLLKHGAERIIAISNFVKEYNAKDLKIPPRKINVVYNATDYSRFNIKIDKKQKKEELNLPQRSRIIAQIGIGTGHKNTDLFIDLTRELLKKKDDLTFLLIGGKEENIREIRKKITKKYLAQNKIVFLEKRNDIPEIMQVIDILCHTSKNEGFGRVITEAMTAGKPVVAFNKGGPSEIIEHKKTGYLADNCEEMIWWIERLLDDEEKRQQLGISGKKRVRSSLNIDKFVDGVLEIFFEVVNGCKDK